MLATFRGNDMISLSRPTDSGRRSEAVNGEGPIGGGEGPLVDEGFASVRIRDGEGAEVGEGSPDQIWFAERGRPWADDGPPAGDSSCLWIVGVVTVPSLLLITTGPHHKRAQERRKSRRMG